MKHALIAWSCLASQVLALEVHEWGTFTVLSGPAGHQIAWYAPFLEVAKLPDFVASRPAGKTGLARIRMETPVIYFYPEESMKVTVEAIFEGGSITETFPDSIGEMKGVDPATGMLLRTGTWSGTLHPPGDSQARSHIPAITNPDEDEPYGAAREVPDAWIFESDLKEIPGLEVQPRFPQMEKFIFYRGVGNASMPFLATLRGDQVTLMRPAANHSRHGVALRVRGDQAGWIKLPDIPAGKHQEPHNITLDLPDTLRPLDEVEAELATDWVSALVDDGLTRAEAMAMVETWRRTWFREEGDRILTLVPRETIDAMLPLKITPEPAKTERVFVARMELVTEGRAQTLAGLLHPEKPPTEAEVRELEQLELGRFENGALEIAIEQHSYAMRRKFSALKDAGRQAE